jgi:hypothetical protein
MPEAQALCDIRERASLLGSGRRHASGLSVGASAAGESVRSRVESLAISEIRKDGDTQHRTAIDPRIVEEYAALMLDGVVFPPVTVWYDGTNYWLTDGFQRVAAAERSGLANIKAEIRQGTLQDAQWDSYRANATHGLRRTMLETQNVIQRALQHPNSDQLSNVQLAKHLNLPEATLRRYRGKLSSSSDEDAVRVVTRGHRTYVIKTRRIGKKHKKPVPEKSLRSLRQDLGEMRVKGSPNAQRLLNIFGNWAFGRANSSACLDAIEIAIREWTHRC